MDALDSTPTNNVGSPSERPSTQVEAIVGRRRFTADYKRRIIKEAAACERQGELGELLRREGLYTSHLASFRKQQEDGRLDRPDGETRKAEHRGNEAARQRDRRRIARLEAENSKLRTLIELQKKLSELFDTTHPGGANG